MITDTAFYHFYDVLFLHFLRYDFDCFAFVRKFCHDYFQVFKLSVMFAKNCDQDTGKICKYQKKKKNQITKKFISKKLQSKTKLYNIQKTVNTTLVMSVKLTLSPLKLNRLLDS